MGRRCRHCMIVVKTPILGIDFFTECQGKSFIVDIAHMCLRDRDTFCAAHAKFRSTPVHSIMKPSWDIYHINNQCDTYTKLLTQFPELTETDMGQVTTLTKPLHIDTSNAVPVASSCRPLHGDKKTAIEMELRKWEAEGIIVRSNSEWASPIHSVKKSDGT